MCRDSSGGPVVENLPSNAGDVGSIPVQGTKIVCEVVIAQSCPLLCDPMDCNTPGFPVLHHLPELPQTHVH